MLINDELRVLFIAIPKTGTRSIYKVLRDKFNFASLSDHAYNYPLGHEHAKDYFKFCTKRDPYERFVSYWWTVCKQENGLLCKWCTEYNLNDINNFINFVVSGQRLDGYSKFKRHVMPQMRWHKNLEPDVILDMIKLEEDFNKLPFVTESVKLPHRNTFSSEWGSVDDWLDRDQKRRLYEHYKEDFRGLGYAM